MSSRLFQAARRFLGPLALLVGSVTATCFVLEGVFRILRIPVGSTEISRATVERSSNPRLLFELRPGASLQAEVRYDINSLGMRGEEVTRDKPRGLTRVAVVGDSLAFGYWVEERDAFPRQLEALLGGRSKVQVLNFGVPGYDLPQYVEMIRTRVVDFAPDVLVLSFCLNDLEGPLSHEYSLTVDRAARRSSVMGRVYEEAVAHSRLLSWIEYRLIELEARRAYVGARENGPLYSESPEEQLPFLRSEFSTLAAILRPRGIPALVAVFPVFGHSFEGYRHRELHAAIVRAARESGLKAVDLLDCFEAYAFRDVRVDIVHPSPLGHRVAAHAIRDALCREGLSCGFAPPQALTCRDYKVADFPKVQGY